MNCKLSRILLLSLAALLPFGAHATAETLRIVTEEYPPYNFTEHGKITGIGTEVVRAVLDELKINGDFQSLPWARAYDIAKNSENVLIYSINRAPERESLFKWVGVITPADWYLYALKGRNLSLSSLEDAKKLQINTVNQDVGERYLLSQGFAIGTNLQSSAKYEFGFNKLKSGRVDLWIMNALGAYYIARQAGDDPSAVLAPVFHLTEISGGGNYMAFGAKTSDAMVERFRKGLETIKKNGRYEAIQKKWR